MREIKFRGQDKDGIWHFGYYLKYHGIPTIMCEPSMIMTNVIPSSVAQWTGLKDKDVVDIYEGDIVKANKSNPSFYGLGCYKGVYESYEIKFVEGSFTPFGTYGVRFDQDSIEYMDMEITGNLTDNKELLEAK